MSFWGPYLTGGLVILSYMTLLWIASLVLRNSSIVDIFWGAGFVMSAWLYHGLTPGGLAARKWLLSTIVTIWGLRLSGYILWRNWGKPEDFRYAKWREENGSSWWWRSYLKVFLLQGLLMWVISAPLLGAQLSATHGHLIWLDIVGLLVWATGFFFEAVGDWQLARFKADPANKGKVLNRGVWRYTRHPNYFGDTTQWWGYYLIALAGGAWWSIFSPIIMTGLLLKVSGVALLEKTLKTTKPAYADYVARTSAFIPLPPKKRS
ncbi:MAG: DUF1295 domain-containing protein [Anaerolineae bacterium]